MLRGRYRKSTYICIMFLCVNWKWIASDRANVIWYFCFSFPLQVRWLLNLAHLFGIIMHSLKAFISSPMRCCAYHSHFFSSSMFIFNVRLHFLRKALFICLDKNRCMALISLILLPSLIIKRKRLKKPTRIQLKQADQQIYCVSYWVSVWGSSFPLITPNIIIWNNDDFKALLIQPRSNSFSAIRGKSTSICEQETIITPYYLMMLQIFRFRSFSYRHLFFILCTEFLFSASSYSRSCARFLDRNWFFFLQSRRRTLRFMW